MDTTPVARRASSSTSTAGPAAAASQMQAVLRSASTHPPPATTAAIDGTAAAGSPPAGYGVAPELMSVSENLDLAILCADNTIRAASLLDLPSDDSSSSAGSNGILTRRRGGGGDTQDPFHTVSFAADCAPRPGDDTIPSDSIPTKAPIKGLEFSPAGHSLLIWGESYVAVARLPRTASARGGGGGGGRATPGKGSTPPRANGAPGAGDPGARWRWTLVDMSGYAVDVMRQRVVQATWHPASDSCVTLLTAGREEAGSLMAAARAYVMLQVPGRQRPEQVAPIADGPSKALPVALAHGRGAGWQRFAVWIAKRDGSVAALCPVVPKNARVDSEELLELWSVTCDKLVAARWERSSNGGENQNALDEDVARLEKQQAWLRETFGDVFDDEDLNREGPATPDLTSTAVAHRRRARGGVLLGGLSQRHLVLQDDIVVGRGTVSGGVGGGGGAISDSRGGEEKRGEEAGAACGLTVLEGAGTGGDARAAASAPPPTVLAVAYRAGCVDIALVPAGVTPRWADSSGTRISGTCSEGAAVPAGAVLESLDLAERSSDKSARRRQGMALSVGTGAWTMLAATPCRMTSITVTWAGRIERAAARARERAAHDLSGRRGGAGGSDGRLDGDLRAVLRERPDSSVAEVLYVPPSARTGIVALTPLSNPLVGHLVLARLGTGMVELVNLAVVTLQATEVASAAKRARAQETPGRGDMLPPFEAALRKAADALKERRLDKSLGPPIGHLLMSELNRLGVKVFEEEADKVVNGGIVVLERLHYKTNTRLQTLGEVYEHQAGLVTGMSRDVGRLRTGQEQAEERLGEICSVANEQRARSASVLGVMQLTRPDVSPAERAFMSEMKDMENFADRQQVKMEPAAKQVEELRMAEKASEDYLLREAEGLGPGGGRGAGTGLSERETRDVWEMLQADRERILSLSRRLEAARSRMRELGVREEE